MAEIDLNDLIIKNDSLPDNWKMLLIDPVTGLPAQNMTIAKFVELVTSKQPEATKDVKGLMSGIAYASLMKFQGAWSNKNVNTLINNGIWLNGGGDDYSEIMGWGVLCVFSASNFYIAQMSISNNGVRFRFSSNSGQSWSNPFMLYTNNTLYAVEESSLTSPISESYHLPPPPPQIACQTTQNQTVQSSNLRFPWCRIQTTRMVQFQLEVYQKYRNNMFGRLTKSEKLYSNYKKKTRDLNKSSISLTIARYNKCNLPRAGPPRLI